MPENANLVVEYKHIIDGISTQILDIWEDLRNSDDPEVKKQISYIKQIEVSNEQIFIKKEENKQLSDGTLYIVVRFGGGATNFASSVAPISLTCLGTANKINPTQIILSVFASYWTTKNLMQDLTDTEGNPIEDKYISQVWNTPEVISNFNVKNTEFRSLFRITGNLVIGPQAVRVGTLTYYFTDYDEDGVAYEGSETVNIMSYQDGYHASPDSQPFGDTHGFAESEVNFSTETFSISTYLLSNHISAAALAVRGFRNRNTSGIGAIFKTSGGSIVQRSRYFNVSPNDKLKIKIEFSNGYTNVKSSQETASANDDVLGSDFFSEYKIIDSRIGQELAAIPSLVITFSR